jgi:hypothetical protein
VFGCQTHGPNIVGISVRLLMHQHLQPHSDFSG